jgi:hypothetical protein
MLQRISLLLTIIVSATGLAFCFFARSLRVTLILSALFAIVIDPLVVILGKIGLGRNIASGVSVLCVGYSPGTPDIRDLQKSQLCHQSTLKRLRRSATNRRRSARRLSSSGARRIDEGWTVAMTHGANGDSTNSP